MRLNEMKQLLAERGIRLTKSLGQNFMHDGNQIRRIVSAAELGAGDSVLEVGPGLGPLTEELLQAGARVLAIEKDRRLCEVLRERFGESLNFELVNGDALDFVQRSDRDWGNWKLVANLPYSVGTPILVELANRWPGPKRMVVTLQLEVVRRIMARPATADYGVLSLLTQLHYGPRDWFKVPAGCFFPEPDVDSACVVLERRDERVLSASEEHVFRSMVKVGFGQRRKRLLKLLKSQWDEGQLTSAFAQVDLHMDVRAEAVTLEQYISLAQIMKEELFDVVNDRDEVVEQKPRRVVHAEGLRHRAVHVLVFNGRGQVFLQKRSMSKDCFPGAWDTSAAGHLDVGESYDCAAVRELAEELGLKTGEPLERLFKIDACPETGQEFVWVYRTESDEPFTLHPEEIERGEWFDSAEVDRWVAETPEDFASGFLVLWKRFRG